MSPSFKASCNTVVKGHTISTDRDLCKSGTTNKRIIPSLQDAHEGSNTINGTPAELLGQGS
jgi:hypothetical protein